MLSHMLRAVHQGIQFVGSAVTTQATGNFSVDISGIPIQPNDVAILSFGSAESDTSAGITGYTLISALTPGIYSDVYYKVLDGTETTVASTTGGDFIELAAVVTIFRGVVVTGIANGTATGTNTPPDCPISGTVTNNKALIVAVGVFGAGSWTSPAAPSGYSDGGGATINTLSEIYTEVGYKVVTAQENPAIHGGSSSSNSWIGITVTLQEL